MNNYTNVEVSKLANIYFEGKVISRNIFLKDGSKKTIGIMLVGEYEFKTLSREVLEIISGKLKFNSPDIISITSLDIVLNSYSPTNITPNVFLEPSLKYIFRLITLPSK